MIPTFRKYYGGELKKYYGLFFNSNIDPKDGRMEE